MLLLNIRISFVLGIEVKTPQRILKERICIEDCGLKIVGLINKAKKERGVVTESPPLIALLRSYKRTPKSKK